MQAMPSTEMGGGESVIKVIKKNRNARKLSLSTSPDDLQSVTETISSIENAMNIYK